MTLILSVIGLRKIGKDDAEDNEYAGFTIETESDDFYLIYDDEYKAELKINFCPVCGRSLKVVYKLNQVEKDFEKELNNAEED